MIENAKQIKKLYIWFNCITRKYPEQIWSIIKVDNILQCCTKGNKFACYQEYISPRLVIYDFFDSTTNLFMCKAPLCAICGNETVSFFCIENKEGITRPVKKQYCSTCSPNLKFAVSFYKYQELFDCIDSFLSLSNLYEPELINVIINYMLD